MRGGDANNEFVNLSFDTGAGGPLAVISAKADATGVYPNTSGSLTFNTQLGGGIFERVRVNSTGNVSIGGIDPVATASAYDKASLHIHQTNSGSNKGSQVHLTTAHTGSAAGDGSQISAYSNSLYINNQENGDTYFYNNGSPTATIKANGSFGIGTQSPADKLVVNGTTDFKSNSYIGGDLYMYGNSYSGKGIFLGGSGSSNKLDDYEEGSFTPYLRGNNNNSSPQINGNGSYVKVGRMVYVNVHFANKNGTHLPSGEYLMLYNLPFTHNSGTDAQIHCPFTYKVQFNSSYQYMGYIPNNNTVVWFYYNRNNATWQPWGTDQWRQSQIYATSSFTYKTSS